jgi:tetratricopeptide (TPR) repeat protein
MSPSPDTNTPSRQQERFAEALRRLQNGQLDEAEAACRAILKTHPRNFDAAHLIGVIQLHRGQPGLAEDQLRTAIRIAPDAAIAHNSRGIALKELGRLKEALASFETATRLEPRYVEAFANRGSALHALGRFQEAVTAYEQAIALRPDFSAAFSNRGNALKELGKLDDARASHNRAVMLDPNSASAFNNRGHVLHLLKEFDPALASFDRAIALNSRYAEAFYNRGLVLHERQHFDDALISFNRAIALQGDDPEAFNSRGLALHALKRFTESIEDFRRAVELNPKHAGALNNMGLCFLNLGRYEEAISAFDQAISLKPAAKSFSNRGNALKSLRRLDDAVASFDRAIALDPDFADAYSNKGNALVELGRFEDAVASYDRAIALETDHADAFYGKALAELMLGRFAEGWEHAEHRWASAGFRADCRADVDPALLALRLDGNKVANGNVLVVAEQGVGDEIMFASMVPDLKREAGDVALECDARLASLFARSFPGTEIILRGSLSRARLDRFDHLLPAGSLGRLYRNSLESFPVRSSYLKPDKTLIAKWKSRLTSLGPGLKIGISWKGGSERTRSQARSIPLELWRPMLELEGARFVSLQYGDVKSEIDQANETLSRPIAQFAREEIDDFDQLAGLVGALDLVLSVQTTIVHLSGAIGRRCWVMVPHVAEWRYGAEGDSMLWYGAAKLYRQKIRGEWQETVGRVMTDLAAAIGPAAPSARLEKVGKHR